MKHLAEQATLNHRVPGSSPGAPGYWGNPSGNAIAGGFVRGDCSRMSGLLSGL
jgi:hypothetical protein